MDAAAWFVVGVWTTSELGRDWEEADLLGVKVEGMICIVFGNAWRSEDGGVETPGLYNGEHKGAVSDLMYRY